MRRHHLRNEVEGKVVVIRQPPVFRITQYLIYCSKVIQHLPELMLMYCTSDRKTTVHLSLTDMHQPFTAGCADGRCSWVKASSFRMQSWVRFSMIAALSASPS
jgi:hypothetical protein